MSFLFGVLTFIVLTTGGQGDMRAITNKTFGIKPNLQQPSLVTYTQGKLKVIPVDTSYISDYTILSSINKLISSPVIGTVQGSESAVIGTVQGSNIDQGMTMGGGTGTVTI